MSNHVQSLPWFVDEEFPVEKISLPVGASEGVQWRRPHELCSDPKLFVDGSSRFDVRQGNMGDCWCMAACAAIAEHDELVKQLVPDPSVLPSQVLSKFSSDYTGRIVIKLWDNAGEREMAIDDRIPVKSDDNLMYAKCKENGEFWVPLVEKALAKFHGGYINLEGRHLAEGLITLTGSSVVTMDLMQYQGRETKLNFFQNLKEEMVGGALVLCAGLYGLQNRFSWQKYEQENEPIYHSCTVTDVIELRDGKNEVVQLIRVRNPWGIDYGHGKWRYNEDVCRELAENIQEKLQITPKDDGEYWVHLETFLKNFKEMCIANKKPSVCMYKRIPATEIIAQRGEWSEVSSGGPYRSSGTYENNPQFLLEIVQSPDQAQLETQENGGCPVEKQEDVPVLIELIQDVNHRKHQTPISIGFDVHLMDDDSISCESFNKQTRYTFDDIDACTTKRPLKKPDNNPQYLVYNYYSLRLDKRYVVVPFTKIVGKKRHFLLRVSTTGAYVRLRALGDKAPPVCET